MMLTGRVLDAEEGQALGLSHYLTGPGEGLARALELAEKIAANSPVTNFAVLQALPRIAEANPAEGYLLESLMAAVAGEQRSGQGPDADVPGRPRRQGTAMTAEPPSCSAPSPTTSVRAPRSAATCPGWREHRGLDFDDYAALHALVGRGPRRRSGRRSGSSPASSAHTPPRAGARPAGHARRRVVPRRHPQLRRARAAPRRRRDPTDGRGPRPLADPRPVRADLGRAARPGRPGPGRAGRGSVSAAATGWWRTCRTSRRPWWRSSPPPAWARSGRAAPRSSARAASSTGSARSSPPCC